MSHHVSQMQYFGNLTYSVNQFNVAQPLLMKSAMVVWVSGLLCQILFEIVLVPGKINSTTANSSHRIKVMCGLV